MIIKRFPMAGRALLVALVFVVAGVAAAGCGSGGGDGELQATEKGSTTQQASAGTQQEQEIKKTTQEKKTSANPQREETVTVRVKGQEGLYFSATLGGGQGVRRVEGSVPESYEVPFGSGESKAGAISASVRKKRQGGGALKVEIVRSGEVVKSKKASGSSGFVNVVFAPREGQR